MLLCNLIISFAKARDGLIAELHRLGARNVVISSNHPIGRDFGETIPAGVSR